MKVSNWTEICKFYLIPWQGGRSLKIWNEKILAKMMIL